MTTHERAGLQNRGSQVRVLSPLSLNRAESGPNSSGSAHVEDDANAREATGTDVLTSPKSQPRRRSRYRSVSDVTGQDRCTGYARCWVVTAKGKAHLAATDPASEPVAR